MWNHTPPAPDRSDRIGLAERVAASVRWLFLFGMLTLVGVFLVTAADLPSPGSKPCPTEAQNFDVAWHTYKSVNHGKPPLGANAVTAAAALSSRKSGGPYFIGPLHYNDSKNPPAPSKWYFDTATGTLIEGRSCRY